MFGLSKCVCRNAARSIQARGSCRLTVVVPRHVVWGLISSWYPMNNTASGLRDPHYEAHFWHHLAIMRVTRNLEEQSLIFNAATCIYRRWGEVVARASCRQEIDNGRVRSAISILKSLRPKAKPQILARMSKKTTHPTCPTLCKLLWMCWECHSFTLWLVSTMKFQLICFFLLYNSKWGNLYYCLIWGLISSILCHIVLFWQKSVKWNFSYMKQILLSRSSSVRVQWICRSIKVSSFFWHFSCACAVSHE